MLTRCSMTIVLVSTASDRDFTPSAFRGRLPRRALRPASPWFPSPRCSVTNVTASTDASDAIVVTAIFHPADGSRDAVLAALEPAIAAVHGEPGCLLYAIHDAPDGSIVMIEKWESVALLDAHGKG